MKHKIHPVKSAKSCLASQEFNRARKIILATIFFASLFCLAKSSQAKNLYVSTTGNDSVIYETNDIDHPWATPQKAWYNAQAGDAVYFRAGTYQLTSMIDTARSNGHEGAENAWIEFTRYENESVTIMGQGNYNGPMLKIGRSYNYIHHLNINANGDAVVFQVGYDTRAVTGFRAEYNNISNWSHEGLSGDNHDAFYIGDNCSIMNASNIKIKFNTLVGNDAQHYQNYCGIQTFGVDNYQIENNDISHVTRGIVMKHSSPNLYDTGKSVANNWIHDQHVDQNGFHDAGIATADNYVTITNNIVHFGLAIGEDGESCDRQTGNYTTVMHNTFSNYGIVQWPDNGGPDYNTIENNIFASYEANGTNNTWDYNMYRSGSKIGSYDLANASPVFLGGSSPMTISGFALMQSSSGYQAASDFNGSVRKDMGADVSLVGPGASSSDLIAPASPSGLAVS